MRIENSDVLILILLYKSINLEKIYISRMNLQIKIFLLHGSVLRTGFILLAQLLAERKGCLSEGWNAFVLYVSKDVYCTPHPWFATCSSNETHPPNYAPFSPQYSRPPLHNDKTTDPHHLPSFILPISPHPYDPSPTL